MPEDKLLVTDLINEVGNKALTFLSCEPFIFWVLEKVPHVIEHDAAAILLAGDDRCKCYLEMGGG